MKYPELEKNLQRVIALNTTITKKQFETGVHFYRDDSYSWFAYSGAIYSSRADYVCGVSEIRKEGFTFFVNCFGASFNKKIKFSECYVDTENLHQPVNISELAKVVQEEAAA